MTAFVGIDRPLIGMVHFRPLPGSPKYAGESLRSIADAASRDADALLSAGFPLVSFSNEADRPYVTQVGPEVVGYMSRLISEASRDVDGPFGCGVLVDPYATIAVARAVDAAFIRLSFGVAAGMFGLEISTPGELLRYKSEIGADDVAIAMNVAPHFATSLDNATQAELALRYAKFVEPRAIQVIGAGAGHAPPLAEVEAVKRAADVDVAVLTSTGVTKENVAEYLTVSDGVIVGTNLKEDGIIWNRIDPKRAREFIAAAS